MTGANPFKLKIQNVLFSWLNMFSIERRLTDDQIEYMQFSICDHS